MIEKDDKTRLTLEMNGQEFSWKGPWDVDINDILDAFYGLLVGATFSATAIPNWIKEWLEDRFPEQVEEVDDVVGEPAESEEDEYGPTGQRKAEEGVNGHNFDGSLTKECEEKLQNKDGRIIPSDLDE